MGIITARARARKRLWTRKDSERLHDRMIGEIDKRSRIYRLGDTLRRFYAVYASDKTIREQLKTLKGVFGFGWSFSRYFRERAKLIRELRE